MGLVQLQSNENIESNVDAALKAIERIAQKQCDLISLPENALFLRLDRAPNQTVQFDLKEKFWPRFLALAKTYNTNILVGSIPLLSHGLSGKPTNTTIWVSSDGAINGVYDKIHLFDVDVEGAPPVRESDSFSPGNKPAIIEVKGWSIGLSICYDLRFSELYQKYAAEEVDLIMVPSSFLVPTGQAHWHVLLRARAIESQCYVVAAAQSGEHKSATGRTRHTYGHSLVVAPWGEILADLSESGPAETVVELTPERISKVKLQIPMRNHRRLGV